MIKSFDPIIGDNAKVLILGTMPGGKSLEMNEYYAFSRNQFWKIMSDILDFELECTYDDKKRILKKNGIALWDILYECDRKGSLDKNIKSYKVNDVEQLLQDNPTIRSIILNGGEVEKIFNKHIKEEIAKDIRVIKLGSTSPAHAIKYTKKLEQWSIIKSFI